jgi:hypothetical protein
MRNSTREDNNLLKSEVLTHYGNGRLQCAKCGAGNINSLTLDHIDNNGSSDKQFRSGNALYRKLKSSNYPEGYQTLCMNCNLEKEIIRKTNSTVPKVILSCRLPETTYSQLLTITKKYNITINGFMKQALLEAIDKFIKEHTLPAKE